MQNSKAKKILEHVIYELFGKGNLLGYEQIVAKDVLVHYMPSLQALLPPSLRGRDAAKKIDSEYSKAFAIDQIEIEDLLPSPSKGLVRWRFSALHKGPLFTLAASHQRIEVSGQTLYHFNTEEKIDEVWQSWDMLGLLQQISIKPSYLKKASLLSQQERQCLKSLLLGKTAKETALDLHLSHRTVEYYFENIKTKLHCFSKKELFSFAHILDKHYLL